MTRKALLLCVAVLGLALATPASDATAKDQNRRGRWAQRMAQQYPWHGQYYHPMWGRPLALVVPPTAGLQTHYGWGVSNSRVSIIHHQFGRAWPGEYSGEPPRFLPQPPQPNDTTQYGVYYIRGPW